MAQKESNTERTQKCLPSNPMLNLMPNLMPKMMPMEFAAAGRKRIDEFVNVQTELLDKLKETNRHWFDRAQSEANLASEFASKLTAARSVPEAMAACQDWTTRRVEMMAQDGKHLLADAQTLMQTGARLMSNGWLGKSGGGSA